jgi:hypothetical protein
MRNDIDRRPNRIKDVLMDESLRKEFLGAATKARAFKAFVAANSENALKTKPKVRNYRRGKVTVMCTAARIRAGGVAVPLPGVCGRDSSTPSGSTTYYIARRVRVVCHGIFATICSISDMLERCVRSSPACSTALLGICDRKGTPDVIGRWRWTACYLYTFKEPVHAYQACASIEWTPTGKDLPCGIVKV